MSMINLIESGQTTNMDLQPPTPPTEPNFPVVQQLSSVPSSTPIAGDSLNTCQSSSKSKAMPGATRSSTFVRPPRPPNAWILYRSDKLRALPPVGPGETRRAQGDASQLIAEMWKNETIETRLLYEQRAEAKKAEHMEKFPDYRFQPMKKEEKVRIKEETKLQKEREKQAKRSSRGRSAAAQPTITTGVPPPLPYPIHPYVYQRYGAAGPSPPMSAAGSPVNPSDSPSTSEEQRTSPQPIIHAPAPVPGMLPLANPVGANLGFPMFPMVQQDPWQMQQFPQLQPIETPTTTTSTDPGQFFWPKLDLEQPVTATGSGSGTDENSPKNNDTLSFEFPEFMLQNMQNWLTNDQPSGEIQETFQALLTGTADPSIFQLHDFDADALTGIPPGEIELSLGDLSYIPEPTPTGVNFDFSNFMQYPMDSTSGNASFEDPIASLFENQTGLGSLEFDSQDFINFDASQDSSLSSVTPTSVEELPSTPTVTVDQTNQYTPPAGASKSTRRVGGTWKLP